MIVEPSHTIEIQKQFAAMQTKTDLLALLNYAHGIVFGQASPPEEGEPVAGQTASQHPVRLKSLLYYGNSALAAVRYRPFHIRKKNGKLRCIHAPARPLKTIQQCLNLVLQGMFSPHAAATGFVPGKSIADNARPHVGRPYVYNLDLKDFFPGVDFHRVRACLKLPPFDLVETREPLGFLIANLCCVRDAQNPARAHLPQGAPTSPVLTNMVCQRLDRRLTGLAKRFGARYTRYADDLTFSSYTNLYRPGGDFCRELERIIADQRFTINPDKTRLQREGYRQEVTGLVVNEKLNVSRRYVRTVRAMLHNWETRGYEEAEILFRRHYEAGKVGGGKYPSLRLVLMGKLEFMKMVRGHQDGLYQSYRQAFEKNLLESADGKPVDLEQILDIWEKQGEDKAMRLFERYKTL